MVPFCFYVEKPDDHLVPRLERLTQELNESGEWLSGAIVFVNEVDLSTSTQPGDARIWSLGGTLWLTEPDEGDEQEQFDEVSFLIDALAKFTITGPSLVIEYAEEEIGSIEGGAVSHSLTAGLLEPWKQRLTERP